MIRARWLLIAVLVGASACATFRREPWVLDAGTVQATAVRRADWVASWPQALATVIDVFERDLHLPRLEVRLVFLPDDRRFEQLLLEIGYTPELARDTTRTMAAVGGHRTVLVNESRVADDDWAARVALLAHELTHVLQYELGGGTRGASDQWVREGFADWVELRVLEALGAVDPAQARATALRDLRARGRNRLPPLTELGTFPEWVAQNQRHPNGELFTQAQVAVTLLVEQRGADRVLDYFSRFASRQARTVNFRAAFGESIDEFDRTFRERVWAKR